MTGGPRNSARTNLHCDRTPESAGFGNHSRAHQPLHDVGRLVRGDPGYFRRIFKLLGIMDHSLYVSPIRPEAILSKQGP